MLIKYPAIHIHRVDSFGTNASHRIGHGCMTYFLYHSIRGINKPSVSRCTSNVNTNTHPSNRTKLIKCNVAQHLRKRLAIRTPTDKTSMETVESIPRSNRYYSNTVWLAYAASKICHDQVYMHIVLWPATRRLFADILFQFHSKRNNIVAVNERVWVSVMGKKRRSA